MSTPKVALIIGAGPNVGAALKSAFAAKGYKLALAARSLSDNMTADGNLHIKVDLGDPGNVVGMFEKCKKGLGTPGVVCYNAAILIFDDPDPILAFSPANLSKSLTINTTSAILAMAESIKGFRTLPASASKTFLYTGNGLNKLIIPSMMTFGMAKTAAAYAIRYAVESGIYEGEGMKFYYLDERSDEKGNPMGNHPTADEAGRVSVELSEKTEQGEWDWTFLKGKGFIAV